MFARRKRVGKNGRMKTQLPDRLVIVPADRLDDLAELSRLAADRLAALDPALAASLRGAVAETRTHSVFDI